MRTLMITSALSLGLILVGCGDDDDDAPASTPTEPTEPAEPAPEPEPPARDRTAVAPDERPTHAIDTDRSTLEFTGSNAMTSQTGSFGEWSGLVRLGDTIEDSAVEVDIQTASLTAEAGDRLTNHLKSDDFFDVERYPTARFSSTNIVPATDTENATHTVQGRLTLHGVSRAVTFPATIELTDSEVHARAQLTIDRQQFQITYPGSPDNLIRDEVEIRFEIFAPRS